MQLQMATYLSTNDFEDTDMLSLEGHTLAPRGERVQAAHGLHTFRAANDDLDMDLGVTRDWLVY